MNRSVSVYISAVVMLAGSVLCLASGLFLLLAAFSPPPAMPAVSFIKYALYSATAISFGFGAWGIATGIGLFRFRRWARISVLIFSGLLLFIAVPGLVFLLIPIPTSPELSPGAMAAVDIVIAVFYFLLIAIAVWWIYLFRKASLKQQFLGELPAAGLPRRPLSITLVACFLLIRSIQSLVLVPLRVPAGLFGFILTGWEASLFYLFYAAAQLWLGFGLLRLKPWSRTLAVYVFLFGIANGLLFVLLPGRIERVLAIFMSQVPPAIRTQEAFWTAWSKSWMQAGFGVSVILMAIAIWFLVTRRKAFMHPAGQPSSPA